jgi:D-alanyl-lipoteichoic acid acyltransferase DltB (MBOAT superfamily)
MLLVATTTIDFLLATYIGKAQTKRKKRALLLLSLCSNLGMLCFFKYTNFFGELITSLVNQPFQGFNLVLPVGISFFVFQSLSYTIDVYRGVVTPLKQWVDYAFYVSFFPHAATQTLSALLCKTIPISN